MNTTTVNTTRVLSADEDARIKGMSAEALHAEISQRQGEVNDFIAANSPDPSNPEAVIDYASAAKVDGPFKGKTEAQIREQILAHRDFLEAARPELNAKHEARRVHSSASGNLPEIGSYTPSGIVSGDSAKAPKNLLEAFVASGKLLAGDPAESNRNTASLEDVAKAARTMTPATYELVGSNLNEMMNVSKTGTTGFPVDHPLNVPGVVTPYDKVRGIGPRLQVIPCPSNTDSLKFLNEGTITSKVVPTGEGEKPSTQALTATFQRVQVEKAGVLLTFTDELAADVPAWTGYISSRLRRLFNQYLETQIISGTGADVTADSANDVPAGTYWKGLLNQTGIKQKGETGDTQGTTLDLDFFMEGLQELWAENVEPDFFAFNYDMMARVLTAKDKNANYMLGTAHDGQVGRIWGIPTVVSPHLGAHKCIAMNTADFGILQKGGLMMETGVINDDFARGQKTIRMVIRGNVIAFRPKSLVEIIFASTAPAHS